MTMTIYGFVKHVRVVILGLSFTLSAVTAGSAASIIARIQTASQSVVEINAQSAGLFALPTQSYLDKKTGLIYNQKNIRALGFQKRGAGIVIDPSGIIVTNAHTVKQARRIIVTLSDRTQLAALPIYLAEADDIALLKVQSPKPLPALPWGDSDSTQSGDTVYSIGASPLLKNTLSEGKITGTAGNSKTGTVQNTLLQLNFRVYAGDSGSPILDPEAKLLGMTVAGALSGRSVTFAIPVNIIRRHYDAYLKQQPR